MRIFRSKTKLLSLFLAICMVTSLVPTVAFANGDASPVQIEVKNSQNGNTQYKLNDGNWIDLNVSQVWDITGVSNGDIVTVRALPNQDQELDTFGTQLYVDGIQETIDCNALHTESGWSFTYTEGKNYKVCVEYRGGGNHGSSGNPGEICFTCQSNIITGGSVFYKLNETEDFTKVSEENNQYNSITLTDADTSVTIKFVAYEDYRLDTTRGVTLRINGNEVFRSTDTNISDFTSESGYTFNISELIGDGSVSESSFDLEFGFETANDNPGGSGDPQPGDTFTPGIRINDRGVTPTVEGAASPQNDGNYTFAEDSNSATVDFTESDSENRVRGIAVRVFDSNGQVSSNRLQQKSYTIDDVNKFYEIEVIDYNAIFDNQYRADYDNSGDKTVKVGNVILDRDNTRTFEKGQPIEFTASEVPSKVIVRLNDGENVELEITGSTFTYIPTTDAGFELKVYWSEEEYNYEQFEGTDALPVVVEYTKDSDTALSLSGAEIADADKITCGNNTKVRVASDVESLTFDWGQNTPKRICVEGEEKEPQGTSYTLDLTQDPKRFYRLEFRWYDDPEPDWYTVSWDGGNVTVENGTVTAERVYLGNKTFTIDLEESGKSDTDKIYPIEGLGEYGLVYGGTDLFIGNDVTEEVSIDFKFKPAYGYQLSDILTNETDSLLSGFTANVSEISTFNFEVRPGGTVHFNVVFAEAEDTIDVTDSTNVSDASIANGQNATESGNLKLTIADVNESEVSEELRAQAGESALYLDMNLYQVVSKGGDNGNWENQLEELDGKITVTLKVPAPASGTTYYVVRQHGSGDDVTYDRIPVEYDPETSTITFESDKFSTYALYSAPDNKITTVSLNITAPTAGATVDSIDAAEEPGSPYEASLEWWDLVPQKGSTASLDSLYYDDTFEADRWYCAVLDLKADFGYRFAEQVELQIEGAEQVEIVEHEGNMLEVNVWFKVGNSAETLTPITSVAVTNVTEVAPGIDIVTAEKSTKENAELSGEGYELRSAYYYMWEDSKWSWESSGEFASDTVYGVELNLRVQPGYLFDENVTVTINGEPAQVWSWEDGELEVFLPFDDVTITDVSVSSRTWPIEYNPIDKSPENFYLSSSHSAYTLQFAEFQKLDYGTGAYRSLSETETTFLLGQYHKYRVQAVLKAMDGAVFGDNVSGSFNGTSGTVCEVSDDGKTCTVTRSCAVYYRIESYDDNTESWINGATIQIPTPVVGETPSRGQLAVELELYGTSLAADWYEVPYPGSTYLGNRMDVTDTFMSGKVYLYRLKLVNEDDYRFADGFTTTFQDMDGNDAPCVQKETVTDTARNKEYYLWFELGDIEYEKITHITITGPALDEEGRIPTSDLSAFTIEGGAQLNMASRYPVSSYFGNASFNLVPSASHYFGRGSELTFTYRVRGTEDVFTGSVTTSSNDHLGSASASVKLAEWVYVFGTITVKDKVYDGTTAAELDLSGVELYGVAEGDDVQLSAENVTAVFDSAEVGQNKPVTVTGNFTLTGADAKKYFLFQPTLEGLTASITAQSESTYTITVTPAANGTVTADQTKAQAGTTVTLTVVPDNGYTIETLTVTDGNGDNISVKNLGDGKYSFTMPASEVSIKATFEKIEQPLKNPFVDVEASAYYYDGVLWAVGNGITDGMTPTTFEPERNCTRAQVVTFLWRVAGKPASGSTENPFSDVKEGAWYYDAVLWAVENGITDGMTPTTFEPERNCTRAQVVTFMWRMAGEPTPVSTSHTFTDIKDGSWYYDAVLWAVENGITNGMTPTTFETDRICTRAHIVTFLYRFSAI